METEEEREQPAEEEEGHTVELDDPEDTPSDDEPAAAAGEPKAEKGKPKSRDEKKRDRKRLIEEHASATRERDALLERVSRLEGALATTVAGTRREAEAASRAGDDPAAQELDRIHDEQSALAQQVDALGNKITEKQAADIQRRARDLDIRKHELIAERVGRRNQPRQDPNDDVRRALQVNYSDVYGHGNARTWAQGWFQQQVGKGREPSLDLVKEALEEARREFQLARTAPTDAQRARYAGVPRGGAGGGPAKATSMKLTKGQMRMADAAFPHIKKPDERYKKWANGPGRKLLEENTRR